MNGLEFLDKIMRLRPMPVSWSRVTARGADATIEALEIGAFDCIAKPGSGEVGAFAQILTGKSGRRPSRKRDSRIRETRAGQTALPVVANYCPDGRLVVIGASTGGVEAISAILLSFPKIARRHSSLSICRRCSHRASPNAWIAVASQMSVRRKTVRRSCLAGFTSRLEGQSISRFRQRSLPMPIARR